MAACNVLHPFSESDIDCCGPARFTLVYEIIDGALPAGLTLDPDTGIISGTSTETVDQIFYITVQMTITNKSDPLDVTVLTKEYALEGIGLKGPKIITDYLINSKTCYYKDYSEYISIANGTPPFRYFITDGILPYGLALNPDAPQIVGIPVKTGIYSFYFNVTDVYELTDKKRYTIEVIECPGDKPILASTMSEYVVVRDNFHQKYLYDYIPTSIKEFKDS
jgi:large repetitive protein